MALNDYFSVDPNRQGTSAHPYQTAAGTTTILPGEPVVLGAPGGVGTAYVIPCPDGGDNTLTFVGVAATTSTQTGTEDGEVYVYDGSDVMFRGKATDAANLSPNVQNSKVTVDLTGGVYTVDEDDTTNGVLVIKNFNATEGTVDFKFAANDHIDA